MKMFLFALTNTQKVIETIVHFALEPFKVDNSLEGPLSQPKTFHQTFNLKAPPPINNQTHSLFAGALTKQSQFQLIL